jgi:hypothetical protein
MPKGLKVSCMLIVNMILFVNISNLLRRNINHVMTFSVAHWDTCEMKGLCFSMQVECIIEYTNDKCDVFTF